MAYTFKELDPSLLSPVAGHIHDVIYPDKKYLGRKISPTVILKDGRTVPLLALMAKLKYGIELDLSKNQPYWVDTNWYNATFTNIELHAIPDPKAKRAGRPSKLDVGVPYDHPDYHKRYMELTRDKQREYRRKRYVKLKNTAVELLDNVTSPPPSTTEEVHDTNENAEAMLSRLDSILTATKIEHTPPPTPSTRPPVRWSSVQASTIPSQFSKDFLDGIAAAPLESERKGK
jgi:hypothetical protein